MQYHELRCPGDPLAAWGVGAAPVLATDTTARAALLAAVSAALDLPVPVVEEKDERCPRQLRARRAPRPTKTRLVARRAGAGARRAPRVLFPTKTRLVARRAGAARARSVAQG